MRKIYYGWTDVQAAVGKIETQLKEHQWTPDYIVAVARGGVVAGVILSHQLKVPMRCLEVSLRDGGRKMTDFEIGADALAGDKILVVDDINDSGATIQWIKNNWERSYSNYDGASEQWKSIWHNTVRFATLTNNVASAEKVDYSVWEVNKSVEDCWLVYPWEGKY